MPGEYYNSQIHSNNWVMDAKYEMKGWMKEKMKLVYARVDLWY